jgi:hypothetical protein
MRFPPGTVCFLCLASYGPPFHHEVPAPGVQYTGESCDYPDVLKELSYILYKDEATRNAVFARLGAPVPTTVVSYKNFIGKRCSGGLPLLGLYGVLAMYLELRDAGTLNRGSA